MGDAERVGATPDRNAPRTGTGGRTVPMADIHTHGDSPRRYLFEGAPGGWMMGLSVWVDTGGDTVVYAVDMVTVGMMVVCGLLVEWWTASSSSRPRPTP